MFTYATITLSDLWTKHQNSGKNMTVFIFKSFSLIKNEIDTDFKQVLNTSIWLYFSGNSVRIYAFQELWGINYLAYL